MDQQNPPPRKKGRFFSNGKLIIQSLHRKKNQDENASKSDGADLQLEKQDPQPLVENDGHYTIAAKGVKSTPITQRAKLILPDRSTSGLCSVTSDRPVIDRSSITPDDGSAHLAVENTESKAHFDRRRQGIYGASVSSYVEHASRPFQYTHTPLPFANPPTRCQGDTVSSSPFSLTLGGAPLTNPSSYPNPNVSHDYVHSSRDSNSTLKDASNQSMTRGFPFQIESHRWNFRTSTINNGDGLSNTTDVSPRNDFDVSGRLSNSSLDGRSANVTTHGLRTPRPWHEATHPSFYSKDRETQPTLLSNGAKQMRLKQNTTSTATDLHVHHTNHNHSVVTHQPLEQYSASSSLQQNYAMRNQQRIPLDQHGFVHPMPPSHHILVTESSYQNTLLDLDRDADGALLPSHLRRLAVSASRSPYVCNVPRTAILTPANVYTSPKRIERAIAVSTFNLKRKRPATDPFPPAYIYVHTNDPNFNIFSNGFLLYPELCLALAIQLPLRDLLGLYSISKDFHTILDSRFTTTCLAQALRKAPQSAQTFRFRMYAEYCRDDPTARIQHPDPSKAAQHIPRKIPSLTWVAFVLHREKVVHELITVFAERGCPLPARCSLALKRIWVILDVPDNARRIAMIHNHRLVTDLDLYFLMCFFVKLDMLANDPVAPQKRDGFRKLLLSQKGGLDVVLKVLKREMWQKKSDFLLAWVRTLMSLDRANIANLDATEVQTVFGVPRDQVGIGKYEYWGLKGIINEDTGQRRGYLLRPDQLVMREAIRRGMRFNHHFLRCVFYGYVRPDTLESYEPRKYGRRIAEWDDEDYDINDTLGGVRSLSIEDGGDPLLDLGNKSRGSRYTIQKEAVSKHEKAMRESQDELLADLYVVSEHERFEQVKQAE